MSIDTVMDKGHDILPEKSFDGHNSTKNYRKTLIVPLELYRRLAKHKAEQIKINFNH